MVGVSNLAKTTKRYRSLLHYLSRHYGYNPNKYNKKSGRATALQAFHPKVPVPQYTLVIFFDEQSSQTKVKKKKTAKGATIKHDGEMYISSSAPLFLFVTWSAKKYLKQALLGIRVV